MRAASRFYAEFQFLLACGWVFLFPRVDAADGGDLSVPSGYVIKQVAGAPQIQFPMFGTFDERGRLFVAESSGLDLYAELQKLSRTCRISVLEDRDGDGRYESARVFVDHLVFPMGLAWHEGRLYVADPPNVVAFEDTDGDGRADKRAVILGDFGHLDNGSLHGLIFGPDGWLYLTMGQPDGYRFTRADGSVISGKSGALIRCRADGSDVEVLSRGFENLVEIDFQPTGEIIGTDNWFSLPVAGVRDALVHLLEGGLYPTYLRDAGSPMLVSGDPLSCIAFYPAVAFSGCTRYRGTGFPTTVLGDFFTAQHNTRKVVEHHFTRTGATFETTDQDFVTTQDPDFHPSDVIEDADGSLVIIDTGSWYIHHCPTGRIRHVPALGGIYRVRHDAARAIPDPRGLALDWDHLTPAQLSDLLDDSRPAVRERAAERLVDAGSAAVPVLSRLVKPGMRVPPAEKVVWSLGRIPGGAGALTSLLQATNADLVALTTRVLGRTANAALAAQFTTLLTHPAPQVELAAAEALAHCGQAQQIPAVLDALGRAEDRFIEHSLINALYHIASTNELLAALKRDEPHVQRAALVLLDQAPFNALPPDEAIGRLFATDPPLRKAARNALSHHSDWVERAIAGLRRIAFAARPNSNDVATLSEMALAFPKNPLLASLISDTLSLTNQAADETKLALVETLARLPASQVPSIWSKALQELLSSGGPLQLQAVRTARSLQLPAHDDVLDTLARNEAEAPEVRAEAIAAVIKRRPSLTSSEETLLFRRLGSTNAAGIRLGAAETLSQAHLTGPQFNDFISRVQADPIVSPAMVLAAAQHAALSGPEVDTLLSYLGHVAGGGWPISSETLAWLEKIAPGSASQTLERLRRLTAEREERQKAQMTELEPLLTAGDPNRGHELFLVKATCATCHRVGQHGGLVGPDLTKVGAIRSGHDLLESLVAPSATFAQGYEPYLLTLKNGDTLSGVRVRQPTGGFVLREAGGTETRLDPADIESVRQSQTSIMPEGLLTALSRDEIRDLLAYLQSLK